MSVDKIYTYEDIARKTKVTVPVLRVWNHRGKLPEPDYQFGRSPAWTAKTIEPWIKQYNERGSHE